ncbi:MAG: rane protein [candidate division NC10 bacterium]|nr:rane protein [candidate division NC10 bacterium]
MNYLVCALVMGVGATVLMDLWAIARRRAFNIPPPHYGLVGRWFRVQSLITHTIFGLGLYASGWVARIFLVL